MYDNKYVRSYNKPVMMGHTLYFGSTENYYVDTSGIAKFASVVAPTATISNATITGDLTVGGVLQANDFIKNIVKAVGGQLYVSPTFQALSSTTVTCTAVTATQLSLTLSDNAINGTDYAGATWYKDSKVMLSGTLTANTTGHTEEIIFSSVPGIVTANMSNSNKLQIKLDYSGASTYFKTGTLTTSDVAVMMYQICIPSGSTNAGLHPIGIYIKAYGTDNKNSYIDIFGGTSNTPNARLGLLTGLSAMQNGTTPSGWGIATTNGFFDGTIVSSSGKIGAFTLSSDLRSGTWGTSGSVLIAGGYTPTTADAKSIGGSPTTGNTWAFTAGNAFGVTTGGKIYASDAEISGKITATSGAIGGFDITSTAIKTKDVAVTSNADNSISLSSADFTRTINGTSRAGLRFAIGDKFGVTGDGAIYASSATISGAITATSLTLGTGVTIAQSQVSGLTTALNGKASTSSVTDAAKTATNFITADGTNGIKVHNTSNTTDYVQIISDGTHIYKGGNDVAFFGDTARIGRIANGIVRTQIDSDSFDVIKRASNTDTVLATFGETATIGNMSARGISIDTSGFKFNNGGQQNFFIGVNNRSGDTITSATATVTNSSTTKTINNLVYYRVASISSTQTVISVVGNFQSAVENGEEVMFAAVEDPVKHWTIDSGYLWVEDGYSSYSSFEESITYTYVTSNTSNLPYMVLGISAYDNDNIPGIISFAQGYKNKATGSFSIALGTSTVASGKGAFACGSGAVASGEVSFACGVNAKASGRKSFACGDGTVASGVFSHAEGVDTTASGAQSHTEGSSTTASGVSSHAEGIDTTASGSYSHAEGYNTTASNTSSHSEGFLTTASGEYSHTEGCYTIASAMGSHAGGGHTVAIWRCNTVIGMYNKATVSGTDPNYTYSDTGDYPFIIGNGTANTTARRSNAFTVDWSGNVWAAGKVMATNTSHIGMIIMSTTLNTMAKVISVYGGTTWIRHDGYMLRGASSGVTSNSASSDGGAETVTLTVNEMPPHTHVQNSHNHTQNALRLVVERPQRITRQRQ